MKKEQLPSEFKHLVETYSGKVYNTCLGFVKNVEEAEDLAQEVFIEIYQKLQSFKGNADVFTWIYRIAVNKSLEHIRKQSSLKRSGHSVSDNMLLNLEGSRFYHPGVSLERKEASSILFEAIGQLPEDQTTAFTLSKVDGLSNTEISKIMQKSVSSIEALLHRAKLNLQKKLKDYHETA